MMITGFTPHHTTSTAGNQGRARECLIHHHHHHTTPATTTTTTTTRGRQSPSLLAPQHLDLRSWLLRRGRRRRRRRLSHQHPRELRHLPRRSSGRAPPQHSGERRHSARSCRGAPPRCARARARRARVCACVCVCAYAHMCLRVRRTIDDPGAYRACVCLLCTLCLCEYIITPVMCMSGCARKHGKDSIMALFCLLVLGLCVCVCVPRRCVPARELDASGMYVFAHARVLVHIVLASAYCITCA